MWPQEPSIKIAAIEAAKFREKMSKIARRCLARMWSEPQVPAIQE